MVGFTGECLDSTEVSGLQQNEEAGGFLVWRNLMEQHGGQDVRRMTTNAVGAGVQSCYWGAAGCVGKWNASSSSME